MSDIKNWRSKVRNLFESASTDYFREQEDEVLDDLEGGDETLDGIDTEGGDTLDDIGAETAETISINKDLFIKLLNHVRGEDELEDEIDLDLDDDTIDDIDTEGGDLEGGDLEGGDEELLEDEDLEGGDETLDDLEGGDEEGLDDLEDDEEVEIEDDVNVDAIANKAVELSAEGKTLTIDDFDALIGGGDEEEGLDDLEGGDETLDDLEGDIEEGGDDLENL